MNTVENNLQSRTADQKNTKLTPVLFVGHGSPMNAIEHNEFSQVWKCVAQEIPTPKSILCISAHWMTDGTRVTAMTEPKTIHDFYGFPEKLYEIHYPAPGKPELARQIQKILGFQKVGLDLAWGLDHGTWSFLIHMYPNANIPVVQLSLDGTADPAFHYTLAKELQGLREQGVLIIGSGNVVHNLRMAHPMEGAYDWAMEFDATVKRLVESRDHHALIHYTELGRSANLSIPTNEHYLPLLYALACQGENDSIKYFAESITFGSISMRGLIIGL
jgi:4,5-DOPA dioxygenase extradiol